ncbi:hypothetical protein Rs2_07539 [Raphanus sativus]|nr:hypothetical protein Rs2_07539 [Raphanus sativus]
MLAFVSLIFQLSQASRVYTVSAPFLMKIRIQSRHKRPFPITVSYGSGVTQLLLPDKIFQQCSIENLGRTPSMFRSVTSTLFEVKECPAMSVLFSIVGVKAALVRLMGCLVKASFSTSIHVDTS